MAKNSFVMYDDQSAIFEKLTDEQAGKLIKAIFVYKKTKELPKLDVLLDMAITSIRFSLDRDAEKYNERCNKNKEIAKMRWHANASERIQTHANDADSDSDNDSGSGSDNDSGITKTSISNDIDVCDREVKSTRESPPKKTNVPYKKIVDMFNASECATVMPTVKYEFLGTTRKNHISARWKRELPTLEAWTVFFETVAQSDFLMGKNLMRNGEYFKCAFDWLIKPSNCIKVLENNFSNHR